MEDIYAEIAALRIVSVLALGRLAQSQSDPAAWLADQKTTALASAAAYQVEGSADPDDFRQMVRERIENMLDNISFGAGGSGAT